MLSKIRSLPLACAALMLLTCALLPQKAAAQAGGRPEKSQVKLPALLLPDPKLEWVKYEPDVKRGNKTMKAGITVALSNWAKYDQVLFKTLNPPVCGGAGSEDSRLLLEFFELNTGKGVATDCTVTPELLKSNTFYILPENQIPTCVYAVLTDRQTGRKAKSNPVDVKGGKVCFSTKNDTVDDAPGGTTTVVTPKKP